MEATAAEELAQGRVRRLPQTEWILPYGGFSGMVMRSRTSPGPDGLSCTAWLRTPRAVLLTYAVYLRWLSQGVLPAGFNWAFRWLPKREDAALAAGDTRSLSVAN